MRKREADKRIAELPFWSGGTERPKLESFLPAKRSKKHYSEEISKSTEIASLLPALTGIQAVQFSVRERIG